MIPVISKSAFEILRQSTFICAADVGVNVPPGIAVSPAMQVELQALMRALTIPVGEAAAAVLAGLLEKEGLNPAGQETRHAVH